MAKDTGADGAKDDDEEPRPIPVVVYFGRGTLDMRWYWIFLAVFLIYFFEGSVRKWLFE